MRIILRKYGTVFAFYPKRLAKTCTIKKKVVLLQPIMRKSIFILRTKISSKYEKNPHSSVGFANTCYGAT